MPLSYCNCSRTRNAYCFFDRIHVCFTQFFFVCPLFFPSSFLAWHWLIIYEEVKKCYLWRMSQKPSLHCLFWYGSASALRIVSKKTWDCALSTNIYNIEEGTHTRSFRPVRKLAWKIDRMSFMLAWIRPNPKSVKWIFETREANLHVWKFSIYQHFSGWFLEFWNLRIFSKNFWQIKRRHTVWSKENGFAPYTWLQNATLKPIKFRNQSHIHRSSENVRFLFGWFRIEAAVRPLEF